MRIVLYTHSLVSDWNHGNAHFLRGILRELEARGHETCAFEPEHGWSRQNLIETQGKRQVARFHEDFPELRSRIYGRGFDHEAELAGADVVIVHEWTDPELVRRLGRMRANGARFRLLFHDTHHRAVSREGDIAGMDLDGYDAVLAFGEVLRELYLLRGWGRRVFTWHEAADIRLFRPCPDSEAARDLVWIGNWGDGERKEELTRFLVEPVAALGLAGTVHGVRYPAAALASLKQAGLDYRGWIASADVPRAYASHRLTVHIPRRPYVESLPGIPTIRVFEALACGIPLLSAPWIDAENLFRPGEDFLFARDGEDMRRQMSAVLNDAELRRSLVEKGLETIRARHTCAHRVDELMSVLETLDPEPANSQEHA